LTLSICDALFWFLFDALFYILNLKNYLFELFTSVFLFFG
jgi:hypothetical protein